MNTRHNITLGFVFGLTATLLGCRTAPPASNAPAPAMSGMTSMSPAAAGKYIAADALDIQAVLKDPPANDSAATRSELDRMLEIQGARTAEDLQRIKGDGAIALRLFVGVLGTNVKPEALPVTEALLAAVGGNAQAVINKAKTHWNRPRPWVLESRLHPCIDKPTSASYPSDRAAQSRICAVVLGELFPAKKAQLVAKADQVGFDRVVAGIHFPSDVRAGQDLGQAIAAKILQSAAFKVDLAAAQAEVAKMVP